MIAASRRTLALTTLASALTLSACAVEDSRGTAGNASLGIARFTTDETGDRTSVIGLDDGGHEIARLDITHGRFAVSPAFADDFLTSEIDGRRLEVSVGDARMAWETEGYAPVLSLPAVRQPTLAAFVEDDVVRQALRRWEIGFNPSMIPASELSGESTYQIDSGWYPVFTADGSDLYYTSYATGLGSFLYNGTTTTTPNLCGGPGGQAYQVGRVTNTYNSVSQWSIIQVCDYTGPWGYGWVAQKTCPLSGPTSGSRTSECGSGSGSCKGCPTIWNMNQTYIGLKKVRDMEVVDTYEFGSMLAGAVYVDW